MQNREETEEQPKRQFLEHLEGAQAKGVEDGIDPWLWHEEGKGVDEFAPWRWCWSWRAAQGGAVVMWAQAQALARRVSGHRRGAAVAKWSSAQAAAQEMHGCGGGGGVRVRGDGGVRVRGDGFARGKKEHVTDARGPQKD